MTARFALGLPDALHLAVGQAVDRTVKRDLILAVGHVRDPVATRTLSLAVTLAAAAPLAEAVVARVPAAVLVPAAHLVPVAVLVPAAHLVPAAVLGPVAHLVLGAVLGPVARPPLGAVHQVATQGMSNREMTIQMVQTHLRLSTSKWPVLVRNPKRFGGTCPSAIRCASAMPTAKAWAETHGSLKWIGYWL